MGMLSAAMRTLMLALLVGALAAPLVSAQPATVYEEPDIPPQAMDFDAENNRFRAHSGWIDDSLIHYYKFRMYVPPNYGTNDGGLEKVPIAPLLLPSTDGTFDGVPADQQPVLKFHTSDGTAYSDFVHVQFVEVAQGYQANSDKTYDALAAKGTITDTGIIANVPLVPTGSTLEDPTAPGTDLDEVAPWMAWFDGHEVQTFVFESTSQDFADYINPKTRVGAAADAGSGWESTVSQFASAGGVSAIPIWHINQYQTGVTAGHNNGGPSGIGQRNVIDKDRLDPGYSPLWQVYWATQVPVGFSADDASNSDQFTEANGFKIAQTPMYVNCPNLGPHGGTTPNAMKHAGAFDSEPDVKGQSMITLEGSIPMQEGVALSVQLDGHEIATTTTGMMGLFTYDLATSLLAPGANTITFVHDGGTAASFSLLRGAAEVEDTFNAKPIIGLVLVALVVFLIAKYGP